MPKSLGQIHTVNQRVNVTIGGSPAYVDLASELTSQLQRMCRAGNSYKVVGIDMAIDGSGLLAASAGATISGRIQYFVPTHGRCEAFRSAFKAMKAVFKEQGIDMNQNKFYDFRPQLDTDFYQNIHNNTATLTGVKPLSLTDTTNIGCGVFEVHNLNQQPFSEAVPATKLFTTGFQTMQNLGAGLVPDFVFNDMQPFSGSPNVASTELEEIPFNLSLASSDSIATVWQWRPDPALYLGIMCGLVKVVIDEVDFDGGISTADIDVSVLVSGWSSIMSEKKKSRKKTSRRRTKSRRSRSKK